MSARIPLVLLTAVLASSAVAADGSPPRERIRPHAGEARAARAAPVVTVVKTGALDGKTGFNLNGLAAFDYTGISVSGAGDVNGDGFEDVVIGAMLHAPLGRAKQGAAFVIFGREGGFAGNITMPPQAGRGITISGARDNDRLGVAVSRAGDVNGDRIDDLIVVADNAGPTGEGAAYVVYGSRTIRDVDLLTAAPSRVRTLLLPERGLAGSDNGEISVSGGFDFNRDGRADVMVGLPSKTYVDGVGTAHPFAGAVYLVYGRAKAEATDLDLTGLVAADGVTIRASSSNGRLGESLAACDLESDGFGDLLLGFPGYARGGPFGGAVAILSGRTPANGQYFAENQRAILGVDSRTGVGTAVACGDVNDDGHPDVIVGAPSATGFGGRFSGRTHVLYGGRRPIPETLLANLPMSRGYVIEGEASFDEAGSAVAAPGDVDGDGIGDILVGAPRASFGGLSTVGTAYVVFGRRGAATPTVDLTLLNGRTGIYIDGAGEYGEAGKTLAGVDINRDGFADPVVGAPFAPVGLSELAGRTSVVFGRATGPIAREGTEGADVIGGGPFADELSGLGGRDRINGGDGEDVITGGADADILTGGPKQDRFVYTRFTDSSTAALRDRITDFLTASDQIDVSAIDANANRAGNQAFTFVGTAPFSGAGQIRYRRFDDPGTATDRTLVYFNIGGTAAPEMQIELTGLRTLSADNFVP